MNRMWDSIFQVITLYQASLPADAIARAKQFVAMTSGGLERRGKMNTTENEFLVFV
ncbi:hypothetical protein RND71_028818 [Anisodus tanguticus]|uniref:Uncharacterized protein n=1 Tax=Anisodus tanguticus TaxID=243964 RepID=A0AAE1RJ46_9SOLA|nr:hypothetical protein RND71_028818 [Anisodus tanguticus]